MKKNHTITIALNILLAISVTYLTYSQQAQTAQQKEQKDYKTCHLPGMAGKQPMSACRIRDFLKALRPKTDGYSYEPKRNTYLFHGVMGLGKTMGVDAIVEDSGAVRIYISMDDLVYEESKSNSDETNNNEKNSTLMPKRIKQIYEKAEKIVEETGKPVVIIFDDVKDKTSHHDTLDFISPYLIKHGGNPYLTTIIITNQNLSVIDKRIQNICATVEWPMPDQQDRFDILLKYIMLGRFVVDDAFINNVAQRTDDFTPRDIKNVIDDSQTDMPPETLVYGDAVYAHFKRKQNRIDTKKTYWQRFNDTFRYIRRRRL